MVQPAFGPLRGSSADLPRTFSNLCSKLPFQSTRARMVAYGVGGVTGLAALSVSVALVRELEEPSRPWTRFTQPALNCLCHPFVMFPLGVLVTTFSVPSVRRSLTYHPGKPDFCSYAAKGMRTMKESTFLVVGIGMMGVSVRNLCLGYTYPSNSNTIKPKQ